MSPIPTTANPIAQDPRVLLDRGLAEILAKVLRLRELADQLLKPRNPDPNILHERLGLVFMLGFWCLLGLSLRWANELQSHATAMERQYDSMSMIKATASLRMTPKLPGITTIYSTFVVVTTINIHLSHYQAED